MENELKTNAVKLSPDEQYQIRKSIVRLSKKGKTNGEIAEILDVSERHVRSVKKQYSEGGLAALKPKKRGRSKGEKRILTPEQEKEVQRIIVDKDPLQLKFKDCMWTRKNISELIFQKYGVKMKLALSNGLESIAFPLLVSAILFNISSTSVFSGTVNPF